MEITGFDSKYHSNNIQQNQEIINNFFGKRRLDANNPVITNIIPPSSWGYGYSGENGMGTDNIQNNDKYEDQFKLQVIKKNDLITFNESNNNFTPFDNTIENNIKECFSMNTKKRDFEQFNDYNEQKTPLKLDIYSGSSRNYFSKSEIEPFFQPAKDMSFVNGMGVIIDQIEDRYTDSIRLERRNERPFEPETVGPNAKGKYTGYHDTTRVLPKLTDELRRADQPKLSYTAEPIKGKTFNKREVITPLVKRYPDKFKELSEKDLIPKSQISSAAIRDNYNLILSNRSILSKEMCGAPKDQVNHKFDIKTKGMSKESSKNKYVEADNTNISGLVQLFNSNKDSIKLPELERNDYQIAYNNVNNQNKVQSYNLNNCSKPTIRQTLNNIEHNNINTGINKSQSYDPKNSSKPTIRQTLNNVEHNNINTGINKTQSYDPNDITKPTIRQSLNNIEHNNMNTGINKTQSYDPNDMTKPTIRQSLNNIQHNNMNTSTNKSQSYDPNNITKPTIRQSLNNIEHKNMNTATNKTQSYDPNNITKPTIRQTLNNIEYNNMNTSTNKTQSYNPNDTTKSTIRQTLNNIDYNNIVATASKNQSYDPNNITKPTIRQTLNNIDYSNIIVAANKMQTMLSDKPKMTIKETLPISEYNNIQTNKNNVMPLLDRAKTTNKENINIDVLNKYSNITLNKKNISSLSNEAITKIKQILDNINNTNINNTNKKTIANLQDTAKATIQLPHFNNENISTFKNIKITDIEKLRNTLRELTSKEIITAPCGADIATTSYLNDFAKTTNKQTTLYENNGNLQSIDGSFVNTYETPDITLKQLLDYNDYLSIVHNNSGTYAYDPNDIAKTTNKEETISYNYDNHAHNPMYGGYQAETYDIQKTFKDITKVVDYLNNPNASMNGNVLKDNYLNAQLNRVKEEITKNRDPTPVGNFQSPDANNINLLLKDKPNINYIPTPRLRNINIDDRVNTILSSLKNNPYYDDRLDVLLQDSLKTNQIINNMVHKSI